ncbi:elongation factor 1-beta-like isoform 1 [Planoprotostelium fungivorum]|uniref:Elongation factor 1-beta-like isoform 1 n=1 Tax=Planoprotostelium fungivorum TaxID=1890364 RepID=A0A2P6NUT5_9EUKA|nr:elongation factor 1-beta-like isoform 1 [Planoprotostelium fungivorum]
MPADLNNLVLFYSALKGVRTTSEKPVEQKKEETQAAAPAVEAPKVEAKKEEKKEKKDDDFDLFGDDEEDEEHQAEITRRAKEQAAKKAEKLAATGKKAESLKSAIVIDVKPWDDTTDMVEMERLVREIVLDGLEWKASKLTPIGYGIKKLQISCHVEDAKVSVDDIQEKIEAIEELVQSTDIDSFTKL